MPVLLLIPETIRASCGNEEVLFISFANCVQVTEKISIFGYCVIL
jgi:hypothetical protein